MELTITHTFVFKVTTEELRLICKALGGRLGEDDTEAAKQLDLAIARRRISYAEHMSREMAKLEEAINQGEMDGSKETPRRGTPGDACAVSGAPPDDPRKYRY